MARKRPLTHVTYSSSDVRKLAMVNVWNILILNHKEGLKDLTHDHDALFMDDLSLQDIDGQALLALLETETDKMIRVLRNTVMKQQGLTQIMAFNKEPFLEIAGFFERKEFIRRCVIERVPDDFLNTSRVTNNLQINVHNYIYNDPETIKHNEQGIIDIKKSRD